MSEARVRKVANVPVFPPSGDAGTCGPLLQFRSYGDFPAFEHNSRLVSGGWGSCSDAFPRQPDRLSGMGVRGRRCTLAGGLPLAASSQSGGPGAPGFRASPAGYSSPAAFANSLTKLPACAPRYKPDRTLPPAFVNPWRASRGPSLCL
jgi:hypothetical protein